MFELKVGQGTLVLEQGDIIEQRVDAIVTAANSALRGGGGVDGAVHRACGAQLLKACRDVGGCATGSAVRTSAFDLEANGVNSIVHAVGPIWSGGAASEADLLASAYSTALEVADRAGAKSVAFPSLSTGVYGYPVDQAAAIAMEQACAFLGSTPQNTERVVFVLFDESTYTHFMQALENLFGGE